MSIFKSSMYLQLPINYFLMKFISVIFNMIKQSVINIKNLMNSRPIKFGECDYYFIEWCQ